MKKNKKRNSAKKKEKSAGVSSPKLIFPVAPGVNAGFTAASQSSYTSDPASCVRELVQNGLDSALDAAGKEIAKVRFVIEEWSTDKIPGMMEYKAALESAKSQQHAQNDLSKDIAQSLWDCAQKPKTKMLFIMDNGIGFDKRRLEAMLSDGVSQQAAESSRGAFGNGHLTAFALSDLRYIFYGGIRQDGNRVVSGHAILASHTGKIGGETRALSKDGYYVRNILENNLFGRFDFAGKDQETELLREKMNEISSDWGSGAVVAITAFNDFDNEGDEDTAEIILRECAHNFYAAIHNEQLRIEVLRGGDKLVLDRSGLLEILSKHKDKRRGSRGFPSGYRIWNSYETLTAHDVNVSIDVPNGCVKLLLRQGGDGKRVALCRNGMWISGDVPMLYSSEFGNRKAFDALVLVNAEDSDEAHSLIKLAETPLHNEIEINRLPKQKRKPLRSVLALIRDEIKERVEQKSDESFSPDDFFPIETGVKANAGERPSGRSPRITKITGPSGGDKPRTKKGKTKERREVSRSGKAVAVNYSVRRVAEGKMRAIFAPQENCEDVELRLSLDGGEDITCASTIREQLYLRDVRVSGETVPQENILRNNNGAAMGARLGAWAKDKRYEVEIDYEVPSSVGMHTVVFDLLRRKRLTGGESKNVGN